MLSSDFEKQVQQKMEELRFTPPDAVWEKVEASLPVKNRRRLVLYALLLAMMAGGGLWFYFGGSAGDSDVKTAAVSPEVKSGADNALNNNADAGVDKPAISDANTTVTAIATAPNKTLAIIKENKRNTASEGTSVAKHSATKKASTTAKQTTAGIGNKTIKKQRVQTADYFIDAEGKKIDSETDGTGKVLLSEGLLYPAKGNSDKQLKHQDKAAETIAAAEDDKKILKAGDSAVSVVEVKIANAEPNTIEKAVDIKVGAAAKNADTLNPAIAKQTPGKKPVVNWEFGLYTAAGFSNIKKGLFEKSLYAADPVVSVGGGVVGGVVSLSTASNPVTAFAWSAGFYAEKNIARRWSIYTGIHYDYASSKMQVGMKIDSAVSLNFRDNAVASRTYYSAGGTTNYTNKYHLLQVPVLVKYRLSEKLPFYIELGPSIGYILTANGLQYNTSSNAYITNKSVFNNWLFSGIGGGGIKLAQKTNIPFSLGYRFTYSPGSITKNVFGKQHLMSSLFYLNIRLKK